MRSPAFVFVLFAGAALAVPPPPPAATLAQDSQVVLVAGLGTARKTSWFWERDQRWEIPLAIRRCLKGCEGLGREATLRLTVRPDSTGSDLNRVPDLTEAVLYLRRTGEAAVLAPVSPEVYAVAPISEPLLRTVESAVGVEATPGAAVRPAQGESGSR